MFSPGWGRTVGGGNASDVLQQAVLPIADHLTCRSRNKNLSRVFEGPMLCAGGEGKGGCQVSVNTVSFTSEVYKLVCLSVCPALCSVHLSVYRFVYLTVCVFLSVQFVNGLCQTCRVRNNLTRVYYGHNATLWSLCIQYFFFQNERKMLVKSL